MNNDTLKEGKMRVAREWWIDNSHPDEKIIMESPDNWEMHCWSKPIHVREVLEPSSEFGDVEEMAKAHATIKSFFGTGVSDYTLVVDENLYDAFIAGHASRQQEVDELEIALGKTSIRNQELKNEISTITKQLDEFKRIYEVQSTAIEKHEKQLDEVTKVKYCSDLPLKFNCCNSCHEDYEEFNTDLLESKFNDEDYYVCCSAIIAMESEKK